MKIDGRKLDHETLEHLRVTCCMRVEAGETPRAVIDSTGLCRTTIYSWLRKKKKRGAKALLSTKASGPKPVLGVRKQRMLRKWVLSRDPRFFGYEEALWSTRIISELILKKFKVKLSSVSVGALLRRLNITPRKPLRRAYERDPERIDEWKATLLPKICKRAKAKNAIILFLDEAGIQSDPPLGNTWGEKGKKTVVVTSGQRQKINAISAVSPQGMFRFHLYSCRFNASLFVQILKKFTSRLRRPCFFIVDGHPAHRANLVKDFVASSKGKIELYFLPPYAPDLNPDEFVWNQIKKHGISKKPLMQNESLLRRVRKDLKAIQNNRDLVRSFFKAESVGYPA